MRYARFCRQYGLIAAGIATLVLASGCTSSERSRALGDENVSGKTIALQVCSTCHGVTGISVSPAFPNLAAQQPAYLATQLNEFRSHRRSDPNGHEYMWGMASSLSDAQIASLASYYASQQPAPGRQFKAVTAKAGQAIVEHGDSANGVPACIGCHGTHAEGNQQFPRLAGQHADYLVKQLKVYQKTQQRPDGAVMQGVAHAMSNKTMVEVADYLESMR